MLEPTSWHDKVLPAAKPVRDLKTCVLAAGLSPCWDLPLKLQHPKERRKGHLREQAVPKQMADPCRHGSSEGRGDDGDLGTVEKCHTGLQDPGEGPGALSVVRQVCCWNYCLEMTCSATIPPLHKENVFRMANNF